MDVQTQKSTLLSVARREVKYLISLEDRLYLLEALDKLLVPDAYGGYNGYVVRSVYFDSLANDDYIDKKRGNPEKNYGRELKESLLITREEAQALLNREYRVLLRYDSSIARYAYDLMTTRQYRPVSLIEYDRRAYTHRCFNTRVTMDSHLRYCDFCRDLFSHNLNFKSGMRDDETILEIKYDRFLFRQIQEVLSQCDLTGKPPGKFGTSRSLLKEYYY